MSILFILTAIAILGVIIVIHELGHFVFCKLFGVRVLKFSIGMGPAIIRKKIGETEFIISSVPLGGYISPLDEEKVSEALRFREKIAGRIQSKGIYDLASMTSLIDKMVEERFGINFRDIPSRTIESKPLLAKVLIVLGGPLFNILFGVIIMYLMLVLGIEKLGNKVGDVMNDSPAQRAGIIRGDLIVEVNGNEVETWDEIRANIALSGETVKLRVIRDREEVLLEVKPMRAGKAGKVIGIYPDTSYVVSIRYNPIEAIPRSLMETWKFLSLTLRSLKMLFSKEGVGMIGGPVALTKITSEAARSGMRALLIVVFFITINLGILNLLPIPVLDGGHVLMMLGEGITRKRISPKAKQIITLVGFLILSVLLAIAFFNDVRNILVKKLF